MKKLLEEVNPLEEYAKKQGVQSLNPQTIAEPVAPEERPDTNVIEQNAVNTAENLAQQQGIESLNPPDINRTAIQASQELMNKGFAQWAIDQKRADDELLAKEQDQIDAEKKAAEVTGIAELGAALANMFGVGGGNAVSQVHKNFSQDWMQKADQDMRKHRDRIYDLRARQNDAKLRMIQLRSQQGLELANYDIQQRQRNIQNALAQRKAELDAMFKAGEMDIKRYEAETKRLQAEQTALYNQGRLANDTMRSKAQASASYSTASLNKVRENQLRNGGSGNTSDIKLTLGKYGDEPEETLHIKPESLVSTIQANYKHLSLSPDEEKAIRRIVSDPSKSADQKADELKSLVVSNPSLRNLVRKSSSKVEKYEEKPEPVAQPVSQPASAPSSGPISFEELKKKINQ